MKTWLTQLSPSDEDTSLESDEDIEGQMIKKALSDSLLNEVVRLAVLAVGAGFRKRKVGLWESVMYSSQGVYFVIPYSSKFSRSINFVI